MADDDLTAENVSEIVTEKLKNDKFTITKFKKKMFSDKLGMLGEHSLLEVDVIKEDGEEEVLKFFVKVFPKQEGEYLFATATNAYGKEIFANRVVMKKMKQDGINAITECTPECYFSKNEKVIVFEFLNDRGFGSVDKFKPFSLEHISVVLKSLSKLHASSLIYEENQSRKLSKSYRLTDEYKTEFNESFFNNTEDFITVRGFEASLKGIVSEIQQFNMNKVLPNGDNFEELAIKMGYKIYELVKSSKRFRNVICHGDLWSSNMLIKHDSNNIPIDCNFVDFQVTRYLPPSHDVMSVIYLNTTKEFRKQHLEEILNFYYYNLGQQLFNYGYEIEKILSKKDFLESCKEQKLFGIIQAATYFQLVLIPSDVIKEFFQDSELSTKALYGDRSLLILPNLQKFPQYRNRLLESIEDLYDYCENYVK